MTPLLSVPYVRTIPPPEPTATCRLCKARAMVLRHGMTMAPHRIRLDPKEPLCPDRGLYASDVAAWEVRQEQAAKW